MNSAWAGPRLALWLLLLGSLCANRLEKKIKRPCVAVVAGGKSYHFYHFLLSFIEPGPTMEAKIPHRRNTLNRLSS
jgi:hypothetical protein